MHIFKPNDLNLTTAAEYIQSGKLVAFPTETVYGLGANAFDKKAVTAIFAAKERPFFDPLISHIADIDFLKEYAHTDERTLALAHRFSPGPITFVLKRKDNRASLDLACAGLPHIVVRIPNHPVALSLIQKSGVPIVAPSANKFKTVSPTTAQHVFESLGNKVDMILDGGICQVGVESTILDMTQKNIVLLRTGGITPEDIENFLNEKVILQNISTSNPTAPGQLLKHYAPSKPLRINVSVPQADEFFIGFGQMDNVHLNLSQTADLNEAASNLFAYLRQAGNQQDFPKIAIAPIPLHGLGLAINDRIKRASYQE